MSKNGSDQKARSERALQEKHEKQKETSPNHPSPGKTPDKGFHPVDREKIIDPSERASG